MLNCKEVTRLCSEEQDRRLSARELVGLKMHLMMCTGCGNFRRQMNFLREAMKRYAKGLADAGREEDK